MTIGYQNSLLTFCIIIILYEIVFQLVIVLDLCSDESPPFPDLYSY